MDFLYLDDLDDEVFLPKPVRPFIQTSFVRYTRRSDCDDGISFEISSNGQNIQKRMNAFLKTIQTNSKSIEQYQKFEKDRCYRHMINERLRRGKQKQTYTAIHSLLPLGTRNEKNSILQMAALHLQELEHLKENLQNRNRALEKNALFLGKGGRGGTYTFSLRRQTPVSGIDSMIGVFTCLKKMGIKARAMHSEFTATDFFTIMEIESKIEAVDVEKAVEGTLQEVEKKYVVGITSAELYSNY